MLNNPIRGIHTDYAPNDIFTPRDANALTGAVPYDYVITKELLDGYREENGLTQSDWVDVGALLWGADTPDYPIGRESVSIFFNFYTSVDDRFLFGQKLSLLGSEGGVWVVHIYSLSSYRSDGGCGTLDLYYHTSGSSNYVLFDSSSLFRGRAVYVGSFACTAGTAIWHSPAPFVYEQCLAGEIPHGSYANEVVAVRQEPWMSNAALKGGSHAIAVMLGPNYCGADSYAPSIFVGASNGHAILINSALPGGGPIAQNGDWDYPFTKANTLKVEGKALAGADYCQASPGLDVAGLSRLDIFTAGGIVTMPEGRWYTANGGTKTYADLGSADGEVYPHFYINGDSMQEGQQLEISISIVLFPPHKYVLKEDPFTYCAAAWVSGGSYQLGDVVSLKLGPNTFLYEALKNGPTSQPDADPSEWQLLDLNIAGPHAQAIPGKTKVGLELTYYSLHVVAANGDELPLYSWGYADASLNGPVINSDSGDLGPFAPLHPSFDENRSLHAGSAPAGLGTLASSQVTLCKVNGKILALGSMYSGFYSAV